MLLNDKQIRKLCKVNGRWGMVSPYVGEQTGSPSYGLGSCGYDIRLGQRIRIPKVGIGVHPGDTIAFDVDERNQMVRTLEDGEEFCIEPHTAVWVESLEHFNMPKDVMAASSGKSTYNRVGLLVSDMVLEPGWRGVLGFALINPTSVKIYVVVGMGIVQLLFQQIGTPDKAYDGSYQEASEGEPIVVEVEGPVEEFETTDTSTSGDEEDGE